MCKEGGYSDSVSEACTPCPVDSYNPSAGSKSLEACLPCPDNFPSAAEGASSLDECGLRETCFIANLLDSWSDGWFETELTIALSGVTTEATVLFDNVGAQFTSGPSWTEGPFCVTGCGCYTAQAGGGSINEASWSLEIDTIDGEIIAEAVKDEQASFCFACSTSCGVGEQPNTNDDGSCELCPKDSYSLTDGGEWCSACR